MLGAGAAAGLAMYPLGTSLAGPSSTGMRIPVSKTSWLDPLRTSLRTEHDYAPRVEGAVPASLRGTLYRNGPGLFERNGVRKNNLLDGDGMIQAYNFTDEKLRYRNRFVRTEKFLAEEKKGEFIYSTWSMAAPTGWLDRVGGGVLMSQAGVTTLVKHGKLLAFDEVARPYALDPETLKTQGEFPIQGGKDSLNYKAHTKTDGKNGDWVLFSTEFGRQMTLHAIVRSAAGKIKSRQSVTLPNSVYMHDFFLTERHILFLLNPMEFSPFKFLLGFGSFIDALSWNPKAGNKMLVLDRNGDADPVFLDAPPSYMWHSVNAYDRGDEIIAEFVGYDDPDHFVGSDPAFRAIMQGRAGIAKSPGKLRRYLLNPARKTLREEIVSDRHYEFPMINLRLTGHRHRMTYLSAGSGNNWYHDGIAAIDMDTGKDQRFHFGPKHFVGEPVVTGGADSDGFLLAQVHHGDSGRTFLAVFEAVDVAAGPVAKLWLNHHVPISFHGWWQAA